MTARRDYPAAFLAALLVHAALLAALGRGLPGRGDYAAPAVPESAPPLTVSLLPAPGAPAVVPAPQPQPVRQPAPDARKEAAAPDAAAPALYRPEGPRARTSAPGESLPAVERIKPRLTGALSPVFPLASRRRGEEGDVRLKVSLTSAGRVAEVLLLDSSGFPALDRSALRAARRGSFAPAFLGGRPVAGELVIRVRFRLEGS